MDLGQRRLKLPPGLACREADRFGRGSEVKLLMEDESDENLLNGRERIERRNHGRQRPPHRDAGLNVGGIIGQAAARVPGRGHVLIKAEGHPRIGLQAARIADGYPGRRSLTGLVAYAGVLGQAQCLDSSPVCPAQMIAVARIVKDGAPDSPQNVGPEEASPTRIGLETVTGTIRRVSLTGLAQSPHARGQAVVQVHRGRRSPEIVPGFGADQAQVISDQLLLAGGQGHTVLYGRADTGPLRAGGA